MASVHLARADPAPGAYIFDKGHDEGSAAAGSARCSLEHLEAGQGMALDQLQRRTAASGEMGDFLR